MTCLLCGKEMEAGEGASTMGLACDECIESNKWTDYEQTTGFSAPVLSTRKKTGHPITRILRANCDCGKYPVPPEQNGKCYKCCAASEIDRLRSHLVWFADEGRYDKTVTSYARAALQE